jgi:hypothetical protein
MKNILVMTLFMLAMLVRAAAQLQLDIPRARVLWLVD